MQLSLTRNRAWLEWHHAQCEKRWAAGMVDDERYRSASERYAIAKRRSDALPIRVISDTERELLRSIVTETDPRKRALLAPVFLCWVSGDRETEAIEEAVEWPSVSDW